MMLDGVFKTAGDNEGGILPPLDMMSLLRTLFPLPRSLTGDGVRATLEVLKQHVPLAIHEVETGTKVFDWDVPREWNIRGATIKTRDGRVLVDFAENNLHVVGYSVPVSGTFSREELAAHVHTLPDQPDAIPYRTSYYAENWGFCLPHSLWATMQDETYEVEIDSDLADGALTYGEFFVPGETEQEILISVHVCHPSLANDNLSGIVVAVALARHFLEKPKQRFGIRFLFLPATIGAITWLAKNEDSLDRIAHGVVLTCIGDSGPFHYKKTVNGAVVDIAAEHVLRHSGHAFATLEFSPYGYDERQYGSPGIALPVGCLMRAIHGTFPEYHTSLDNCDFVTPEALTQSFRLLVDLIGLLQRNATYRRVDGRGEPQLGRRGLYRAIAGQKEAGGASQMDLLWVLNQCDGNRSLLDIAERAKAPFSRIRAAADLCLDAELITEGSAMTIASIQVEASSPKSGRITACRSCGGSHLDTILDLGDQPLANALLEPEQLGVQEPLFPLEVVLCQECGLLQVSEDVPPEILFGQDYPYFSSFIPALLAHSREHALDLIAERKLGADNLVVEIASNDGYLLKNFVEHGIPVLGIDPASGPAKAAIAIGVPTIIDFFGRDVAEKLVAEGKRASVMLANNVLAHVNDINYFVEGFAILLADDGIAEFEFPYVRDLIETCAFDTIYHEHFFYYSLAALEPLMGRHGLYLNDAKKLDIHGGSLRLRVSKTPGKTDRLQKMQDEEAAMGLTGFDCYRDFGLRVEGIRDDLRKMLGAFRDDGKTIAAYGAAAKGATLLNYADLPAGTISYVVDRNTHKVGKFMPGVRLPIRPVEELATAPTDYLLILPWNFADEIVVQQAEYYEKGGTFLKAIPYPQEIEVP